jgi:hypothetical protein
MFHDHLTKLLKELNIEGVTVARDSSSFSVTVDGVPVVLTEAAPGIDLSAALGACSQDVMTYSKLLRGNFFGKMTRKARLGLDEEGKNVLLLASIPTIRSYREFHDVIEDFVNSVIFWKKQIQPS